MSEVVLSWHEVAIAASIGVQRQIEALKRRLPNQHGMQDDPRLEWGHHIEGVCGEMVLAKALGVYYVPTLNTFREGGDVLEHIQVRTRSRHDYELNIRPNDKPHQVFVLVTGRAPRFIIRGWIMGADARRNEWWHAYGGRPHAWFVPQDALADISTLTWQ